MRTLSLALLLAVSGFAADAGRPVIHINNFALVNAHLMRGAQPSLSALQELNAAGVKLVIDLREKGEGTDIERSQAEKLGLKYTNIPFPPLAAPSPDQVRTVLNLILENQSQTVFIHCRRGKDRTGTVIACYRVQHDGWKNDQALDEAKQYGMSFAERGMRSFIMHFTPISNAADPGLLTH